MSAIDAAMLASMRSAIGELLPDTCSIVAQVQTPDGEGGVITAGSAVATAIPCRLDALQGREQVSGGAIEPFISYMMSMPYDTVVAMNNTVQHGGLEYAVKSVNYGQSWSAVLRVELERIF